MAWLTPPTGSECGATALGGSRQCAIRPPACSEHSPSSRGHCCCSPPSRHSTPITRFALSSPPASSRGGRHCCTPRLRGLRAATGSEPHLGSAVSHSVGRAL